jgi:hypothetical protein
MLGRLLVAVRDAGDVSEAARRLFTPAKGDALHDERDDDGEGASPDASG